MNKNKKQYGKIDPNSYLQDEDTQLMLSTQKNLRYFGIKLKKGYTLCNLLAIQLVVIIIVGNATFNNISTILLLKDPNYFDVGGNLGIVYMDFTFYSYLTQMVFCFLSGYLFELIGRRKTLVGGLAITILIQTFTPLTSNSLYPKLLIVKLLASIFITSSLTSPLINDYISKESRGRASAFLLFGVILGDTLAYGIIMTITKNLKYQSKFIINSTILTFLLVCLFFMIREPKFIQNNSNDLYAQQIGVCQKIKQLTKQAKQTCKNNAALLISFIGTIIARSIMIVFNTFFLLKLLNYVDNGVLDSDQDAKEIMSLIGIYSMVLQCLFFIFLGNIGDKVPAYINIPISFMIRATFSFLCTLITNPNNFYSYFALIFLNLSSYYTMISVEALFSKNLPKEIRGILRSIQHFFTIIGLIAFTYIGNNLFYYYGDTMPFYFLSICDYFMVIISTYMSVFKKFQQ